MEYVHSKHLQKGLTMLAKRGGKFQKAAQIVYEVIGKVTSGDSEPFRSCKATNYGENRLKHCVKYDLTGACRLVTVVHADITFLLYVGDHEDVDSWLDRNRGREFAVDEKNQLIEVSRPSDVRESGWDEPVPLLERYIPGESGLLERLDSELVENLLEAMPYKTGRALNELTIFSTDDEISSACILVDQADLAKSNSLSNRF